MERSSGSQGSEVGQGVVGVGAWPEGRARLRVPMKPQDSGILCLLPLPLRRKGLRGQPAGLQPSVRGGEGRVSACEVRG